MIESVSVWKWEKCNLWDTVSEGVWVSEECALKKKRQCASDCEMVCIKGRECVWVWVRVMWKMLYSQVASRRFCLYTKFTLYFILVRMYSLLLCSSFCLWLEKKWRSAPIHTKCKIAEYSLKMPWGIEYEDPWLYRGNRGIRYVLHWSNQSCLVNNVSN